MSDTVDLIKQDHRKVEELFAEYRKTASTEIAEQICVELTVHARLEEELLYPLLRSDVNSEDAEHAQEEHDEAKEIIEQIQSGDATGSELTALITKLEQVVTHHVQEEESEILPKMEREVGSQLHEIFATVVERKQELMEEEEQDDELLNLNTAELQSRAQATAADNS